MVGHLATAMLIMKLELYFKAAGLQLQSARRT